MARAKKTVGVILYEGISRIDKKTEIVAIANGFGGTTNEKTGDMVQVWILSKNVHPCTAKKTGADFAICGDCKHRDFGSCYVHLLRGPIAVYNAYKNGSYEKYNSKKHNQLFEGKFVRWGAYGEPVAIPLRIIKNICKLSSGWTGYSHQWKKAISKGYQNFIMASVDTTLNYYKEYYQARSKGWRTFRATTLEDNVVFDNEFSCPASKEQGKVTNCLNCNVCCGTSKNMKNVVIKAHGVNFKIKRFEEGMKKIKNKKKYRKSS